MTPLKNVLKKTFIVAFCLSIFSFTFICSPVLAQDGTAPVTLEDSLNDFFAPFKNIEITDTLKLTLSGQSQLRWEYKDDFDFNDTTGGDDGYLLIRNRINADLEWEDVGRFFIQAQDSQVAAGNTATRAANRNSFDFRQLYVDVKNLLNYEEVPLTLRVGRQELSYGDQRFVGGFNWSNLARSFDAIKLMYRSENWRTDIFWANVVIASNSSPDERSFRDQFFGLYATYLGFENRVLDTFVFYRMDHKTVFSR